MAGKKKKRKAPTAAKIRKKAWDAFSRYIRMKYADDAGYCLCYTCGSRKKWNKLDAGHAIPSRNNAVLLDEEIVRPQDKRCNIFMRGKHHIFGPVAIVDYANYNGVGYAEAFKWWWLKCDGALKPPKYGKAHWEERLQHYTILADKEAERLKNGSRKSTDSSVRQ